MVERPDESGADVGESGAPYWSIVPGADYATLVVGGEIDVAVEADLTAAAEAALADGPVHADLSEVSFIDSTGVRIFLRLRNRHEARFVVAAASKTAMRVFELAGVADHLMGFEPPSRG